MCEDNKDNQFEKNNDGKYFTYVPHGAKLNYECANIDIPETEYERRKMLFNRDVLVDKFGIKKER